MSEAGVEPRFPDAAGEIAAPTLTPTSTVSGTTAVSPAPRVWRCSCRRPVRCPSAPKSHCHRTIQTWPAALPAAAKRLGYGVV